VSDIVFPKLRPKKCKVSLMVLVNRFAPGMHCEIYITPPSLVQNTTES